MMIVEKIDIIHKCSHCKRIAKYKIDFCRPFVRNLHLCRECVDGLYLSLGKVVVPRGIENINKKIKIKE